MRQLTIALLPCLASIAFAQEANLTPKAAKGPVKFEIKSTAKVTTEREVLRDGEAMGGGGGRGGRGGAMAGLAGPRESTTTQTVVFAEGDGWRSYETVEAVVERAGRDGEMVENEVKGALAGRKVSMQRNEQGEIVLVEGEGDDAAELPANLARGLSEINLNGLLPGKTVKVGDKYEIDNLGDVIGSLMHPVAVERPTRGEQGERGGRGGRGGDQRGGRGAGGRFGGAANPVEAVLALDKLNWEAHGTLVSFEGGIATVELVGNAAGKGSNEELGIQGVGGMFGRGRRAGRGGEGAPQGESNNNIALAITGKVKFNVDAGMITEVELNSDLKDNRESKTVMNMRDQEMEIETKTKTAAKVALVVHSAPAK